MVMLGEGATLTNREAPTSKPERDGIIERKVEGKEILPRGSSQIAERDLGLAERKHSETVTTNSEANQ